ncbi:drug resistance transporter, EmrB/QacA subfamily [Desulforamulus reducens MI-1]|uniref:Drug resistance transporter, EmrB/QacA subfamily n=1 Tax=Desulforamulus reducens (strain ATCC BAA-1160 / DSM 100696 / MI-1) TaxID=349161 RepID=A4J1P8_DESRM|nr:DHA2 family efflux MFS transporter permease subunit [Desulforamulus reducens]ABO49001.1 drug resistance transporter, EmrB/QacA subfamily [Desulforamulus reducens MI-1]
MILVIGAFMAILDSSIVNVALPRFMTLFGSSADEIQWILTGYMLTSGVVVPITGYLGDRFGNKRMYIWSVAAFTIGSLLCGLAWSTNSLTIFRVIQAIGGGMIIPISMAMIYRIIPRQKIGMALGIWGIAAIMAPAIGPTLGGYLVDHFSWQWIFTINIPIGIAAIMLSIAYLEETPIQKNLKPDIPGILLSSVGCFALLLALSEGQDKGWTSQYIVTLLVLSAFTLILFVMWELQAPNPLIDIRLLNNPVLSASLLATCIATIGLFSAVFLIPIYAQNLLGYTPMETGLMMMPMALVTGFMMPISGKLFDKFGAFWLGIVGMSIVVGVTYYLHTLGLDTSYHHIQIILSIRAVGLGLATMPLTTAGMNTVPRFLVGRASALNNTVRQISGSMGIAYLTYVMLQRQAYHTAILTEGVSISSMAAVQAQGQMQSYLAANGMAGQAAAQGSLGIISGLIARQSFMTALDDTFVVSAIIIAFVLPMMFLLSKHRVEKERKRQEARYAHLFQGTSGVI